MANKNFSQLNEYFSTREGKTFLLVHGNSMNKLRIGSFFDEVQNHYNVKIIHFTDYHPNPDYESIKKGIDIWNIEKCNEIIAVGGGSAIDVAKCIKLFVNINPNENYLKQTIFPSDIPFLAIPTTAGSGSEATQFAVVYHEGKKYSVDNESARPNTVYFDATAIQNLPEYQKKSTLLDALCHAIESSWSLRANRESLQYSSEAIRLIEANREIFVSPNPDLQCCTFMLYAAHLAGQAINISRTTAGHAMSYKLASLYKLAHGHAVALCLAYLFPLMQHFYNLPIEIDLYSILRKWNLIQPLNFNREILEELVHSVNIERLLNNPVKLNEDDLRMIYKKVLSGENL